MDMHARMFGNLKRREEDNPIIDIVKLHDTKYITDYCANSYD